MTHLAVAIFVTDLAKAKADIAAAAEAGADMVELRIDTAFEFNSEAELQELISTTIIPCIVTCRPTWEGGQCLLADSDRIPTIERMAEDAAYVDLELHADRSASTLIHLPRDSRPALIFSSHDFQGRPERLYNIVLEMNRLPSEVNKIVWTARTLRDNLEAFELLRTRQKPTIALCMGETGLISRILAKKFGAFLTFASLDSAAQTAPGQIPISDMKRLYRWDSITPNTKVYGVVAQPVMHSMSPAIHNAAFTATEHDGVYLPLLVEGSYESFKAFMESFLHAEGLDLAGLSITLPHKQNALRYLQYKGAEIEPLALRIGAVNTIVIRQGFRVKGSGLETPEPETLNPKPSSPEPRTPNPEPLLGLNTDYPAILDSITSALNIQREDLTNYRVAVIGAGGTGRTAVAALAHYGATVVVYNRTRDRADALAAEFNGQTGKVVAASMEKLCDSCCQIYINTTSVGMHPNVDESPLGDSPPNFTPDTLVFDTIYNPMKTKFLQQAQAAGAKTIGGIEMFLRQAAAQFQAWTGLNAPTATMREVIENRLTPPAV